MQPIFFRNIKKSLNLFKCYNIKQFTTKQKFSPNVNSRHILWPFIKLEIKRISGAVFFLVISSSVTMSVPLIAGTLLDIYVKKSESHSSQNMRINIPTVLLDKLQNVDGQTLAIYFIGFFMLGSLANFARFYLITTAGRKMTNKFRNKIFESLVYRDVKFWDKSRTGELVSRIVADTTLVGEGLTNSLSGTLRYVLSSILGLGFMINISPQLTMYSALILPVVGILVIVLNRKTEIIARNLQNELAKSTDKAVEIASAIKTVKLFGREAYELNKYEETTNRVLEQAYKDASVRGILYSMMGFTGNLFIIALFYKCGLLISSDMLTMGQLSSFISYSVFVSASVSGLMTSINGYRQSMGAGARILELLQENEIHQASKLSGQTYRSVNQLNDLLLDDIYFSYSTGDGTQSKPVLQGLTMQVKKGEHTAIIGPSGCGKSTIGSLLMRFYDVQNGEDFNKGKILMKDGENLIDINHIDMPCWRNHVSGVLQDPVLYASCSIRENICYGLRNQQHIDQNSASVDDLIRRCGLEQLVKDLDNTTNSSVGERGNLLSGGQRQRVALARALIGHPQLLILDEATSGLDRETEYYVMDSLKQHLSDLTLLTITHKVSSIINADIIYVLDRGKVVFAGRYSELINGPHQYLLRDSLQNFNNS